MRALQLISIILSLALSVQASEKVFIDVMSRFSLGSDIGAAFVSEREFRGFDLPYQLLYEPQIMNYSAITVRQMIQQNNYYDLYAYCESGALPVNGFKEKLFAFFSNNDMSSKEISRAFKAITRGTETGFLLEDETDSFYEQFAVLAAECDMYDVYYHIAAIQALSSMNVEEIIQLCRIIEDNPEHCIIGGPGDDVHYDKPGIHIIIDWGGNDTYHIKKENMLIIDLSGNDRYTGNVCSADRGASAIIDIKGNDKYIGESFSIACAVNGAAMINDRAGDDIYIGEYFTTGAALNGLGLLLDEGGNDTYIASGYAQGLGMYRGLGIIADYSGNDVYLMRGGMEDHREEGYHAHLSQGFGFGVRDMASGGVGVLYDQQGNDLYSGEYFVQGSSYFYAIGMLIDENGNDSYISRRYAQGAGIHHSSGLLCDIEGNDSYMSWGVSQGCGHDWGTGILCDFSGDDNYSSHWLSMGASNASGIGLLADMDGNDRYSFIKTSCGYADTMSSYAGMGILYDKGGQAIVNGKEAFNALNGKWGIIVHE